MTDRPLRIALCQFQRPQIWRGLLFDRPQNIQRADTQWPFCGRIFLSGYCGHRGTLGIKSFGTNKMNARLLEMLARIEPDILLLGHSEMVSNNTLGRARCLAGNENRPMVGRPAGRFSG